MTAPVLEFNHETHTYSIEGKKLPSVTQIIGHVIPRQFSPGEWYMSRGSALHAAIHLVTKGVLDPDSIDPRIAPRLRAVEKFMLESGYSILASELPMFSAVLGYAGTADAICQDGLGRTILVDWKSSLSPEVSIQMGGYLALLNRHYEYGRIQRACAVELRDNGSYSAKHYDRAACMKAEQLFLSTLTVYGFMKQHKIKGANETA